MADATHIEDWGGDTEIRYARYKSDTWPGFHETCPLGKKGFWHGNDMMQKYIGHTNASLEEWKMGL